MRCCFTENSSRGWLFSGLVHLFDSAIVCEEVVTTTGVGCNQAGPASPDVASLLLLQTVAAASELTSLPLQPSLARLSLTRPLSLLLSALSQCCTHSPFNTTSLLLYTEKTPTQLSIHNSSSARPSTCHRAPIPLRTSAIAGDLQQILTKLRGTCLDTTQRL
jgi:hypothetical protein